MAVRMNDAEGDVSCLKDNFRNTVEPAYNVPDYNVFPRITVIFYGPGSAYGRLMLKYSDITVRL